MTARAADASVGADAAAAAETETTEDAGAPLWLDDPRAGREAVAGGKAAPLARLLAAGGRVPPGFVVPAAAYRKAMAPVRGQLAERLAELGDEPEGERLEECAATLQALVRAAALPEGLAGAIEREALALLARPVGTEGSEPARLAVRSSATAEDLPGASFAGQYDTYLGIESADGVVEAVRKCWASYWTGRAIAYRRQRGLDHLSGAMAVLVQRLVPADAAGVAFTAHPTTGYRHLVTVNAALGLGEGVVDGKVPADTYCVDTGLNEIVHRTVAVKTERVVAAGGATEKTAVDEETAKGPALSDTQLLALAAVAREIEERAGCPQDVEWARCGEELYVLQSRPITALPEDPAERFGIRWDDPKDRARHWRLNRSYEAPEKGKALKPLALDMHALFERSWVNSAYLVGRDRVFDKRVLGPYLYTSRRMPFLTEEARLVAREAFGARVERAREAGGCLYREEQQAELEGTNVRLRDYDREGATDVELADHLEEAARVFVRHWTLHWLWWEGDWNDWGGGQGAPDGRHEKRWERLYQELTGDTRKNAHLALLEGLSNRLTEAVDGLLTLARIAQRYAPLREAIESEPPREVLVRIERGEVVGGRAFLRALGRLLAAQGLRTGDGAGADTTPLTPPWMAEPSLVLETVRHYLPQDIGRLRRVRRAADRRRERRTEEARRRVGDDPEKRERFERALAAARESARWFEDHNYLIDSATHALHYLALTAGARRLVGRGVLEAVEDVLWLKRDEVCAALRDAEHGPLRGVVAERKAEHERWERLTPPPWLGAPPPPPTSRTPEQQERYEAEKSERTKREGTDTPRVLLRGQGGSRGVATGRVRIIASSTPVPDIERGDVLVAHDAGPMWTPVFPVAGAIVLAGGTFFQHPMITAREYRVPAVFQAKGATTALAEGQRVTVDGTRGLVLRPLGEEAAPVDGAAGASGEGGTAG